VVLSAARGGECIGGGSERQLDVLANDGEVTNILGLHID
jgi:hypothetical protein